jgi:hypothetical protein
MVMGELESSTDTQYYFASGPDDPPKGPFSRAQLSHALHQGYVDPKDRIWVSAVNSWLVARDIFSDFFESDIGILTLENRRRLLEEKASNERKAAVEDFGIQFALFVSLGAVLALVRVPMLVTVLLALAVPFGYWVFVQLSRAGQSVGMERNCIEVFQNSGRNILSFMDGLLRGVLSFYLILCFGIEFQWRPRHRVTLSSHLMAAFPVFGDSVGSLSSVRGKSLDDENEREFARPSRSHSGTPTVPAIQLSAGPLPQRPMSHKSKRVRKDRSDSPRPVPGGTRPRGRAG